MTSQQARGPGDQDLVAACAHAHSCLLIHRLCSSESKRPIVRAAGPIVKPLSGIHACASALPHAEPTEIAFLVATDV